MKITKQQHLNRGEINGIIGGFEGLTEDWQMGPVKSWGGGALKLKAMISGSESTIVVNLPAGIRLQ